MNIILCDDNEHFLSLINQKLQIYLEKKDISFKIKQFKSGEELLRCNISQMDLIFLDIRMMELDGLQVAHILRKRDPDFILIFITSYIEYAPLGYETKAFRYILKDQLDTLFDGMMDTVLKEMDYCKTEVTLDFSFGAETFFTDNLHYVESKLHVTYFNFHTKVRHIYNTLDTIEKILPAKEFVRIHKSYLVNIKHIVDVKNYTAFLDNGLELPISQRKFSETKKRVFLYRGRL